VNDLIRKKIARVNDRKKQVGYRELMGCTEADTAYFKAWISHNYPIENGGLTQYIELMQIANGFNHNSLYIYGISAEDADNIYNMNTMWKISEEDKAFVFLGHNDISLYCFDTLTGEFCDLDRGSMSFIAAYATFDDLITEALEIAVPTRGHRSYE
jgi:hypothetical protein